MAEQTSDERCRSGGFIHRIHAPGSTGLDILGRSVLHFVPWVTLQRGNDGRGISKGADSDIEAKVFATSCGS